MSPLIFCMRSQLKITLISLKRILNKDMVPGTVTKTFGIKYTLFSVYLIIQVIIVIIIVINLNFF